MILYIQISFIKFQITISKNLNTPFIHNKDVQCATLCICWTQKLCTHSLEISNHPLYCQDIVSYQSVSLRVWKMLLADICAKADGRLTISWASVGRQLGAFGKFNLWSQINSISMVLKRKEANKLTLWYNCQTYCSWFSSIVYHLWINWKWD